MNYILSITIGFYLIKYSILYDREPNALKIYLSQKLNVINNVHVWLLSFFVYLFQSKNLIGSCQQMINLIGRLKKINKKQQQPNLDIAVHVQLLGKLDF